ncbi:MAG: hypothetical protein AAB405_02800 [Patescibacteria group bacterium]
MVKIIVKFFDRLEDKVRASLSRRPIVYTFIGAVAIVLFWRGVWMTADMFEFMNGPVSILLSVALLLLTGLFVSFFIGDRLLISGLKQEKKIAEKTELEIRTETDLINEIKIRLEKIEKNVDEIKGFIKTDNNKIFHNGDNK